MNIADYLIHYIYNHISDTVFTIAGGGAMYLNDAVYRHGKFKVVCCHHEQSCAYAATGYTMMCGKPGVVMVTSGPGSTNVVSGLLEAYQSSIPMFVISSQSKTSQMSYGKLRQFGVQEVDIIPLVKPLTKYAAYMTIEDHKYFPYRAYHTMILYRQGPVWLDVPQDVASYELKQIPKKI